MNKSAKKKIIKIASYLDSIKAKFDELKKIRAEITKAKTLYAQHDALMLELLPLFITVSPDQFIIRREIILGSEKYRFTPYFYDEKKGHLLPKVWKSTCHESGAIE